MLSVMNERCQCRRDSKRRGVERGILILGGLELLLAGLVVIAVLRAQESVAAVVGAGCVSIGADIARRVAGPEVGGRCVVHSAAAE